MAVAGNGAVVPAGSDVFDPAGDLVDLNASLKSRLILPAVNQSARLALAASCGWTPTATDPLLVWQTDTEVLWVHNGTAWLPAGGAAISGAVTYGGLWRAPKSQPGAPISFIKTGTLCTVMGGQFENTATLALPIATGQNANALSVPAGCAPAEKVIVPAFITNTSAGTNTLGSLWFLDDGTVTFQTAAAISAAPVGTVSVAIGGAQWVTP